jgi:hypothetical protein
MIGLDSILLYDLASVLCLEPLAGACCFNVRFGFKDRLGITNVHDYLDSIQEFEI